MFGSLDPAKLLVIFVIALVVLGPERLPKAARQLGAAWRELTRIRDQVAEEVRAAVPDLAELDLPRLPRQPGAAVANFVRDLASGTDHASATERAAEGEEAGMWAGSALAATNGTHGGGGHQGSVVVSSGEGHELTVVFDDASMN